MQQIPLEAVPSQTLNVVLGGQSCALSLYTLNGYDYTDPTLSTPKANLYMDFSYNGVTVTTTSICLSQKRILMNRQYLGFVGDLMFIDTQGSDDPQYAGLANESGGRWVLVYLEASDLAAAALALTQ